MKTDLLRLNSVVPHGVGSGPECSAIELIYSELLHEFKATAYSRISINQIGNDLNEFIIREPGNKIHINIRYPALADFEHKNVAEKNRIRLDVIHTALLRIAEYDKKIDIMTLAAIRDKILQNDFSFQFPYKTYMNKKYSRTARIIISPEMNQFRVFTVIEENGKEKCRILIFQGIPGCFYLEKYFCFGKWKDEKKLIISGHERTVETHVLIEEECKVEILNLTAYQSPPYFTLMRADISEEEREKARKDWYHSLPPSHAAILNFESN